MTMTTTTTPDETAGTSKWAVWTKHATQLPNAPAPTGDAHEVANYAAWLRTADAETGTTADPAIAFRQLRHCLAHGAACLLQVLEPDGTSDVIIAIPRVAGFVEGTLRLEWEVRVYNSMRNETPEAGPSAEDPQRSSASEGSSGDSPKLRDEAELLGAVARNLSRELPRYAATIAAQLMAN